MRVNETVRQAAHDAAATGLERLDSLISDLDFVIRNGGSLPQREQELLVIARARVSSVYRPLTELKKHTAPAFEVVAEIEVSA